MNERMGFFSLDSFEVFAIKKWSIEITQKQQ